MTNSKVTEPSVCDSGQWFVKITFSVEELKAMHAVLETIHGECLFGAGVDVWLAPGGTSQVGTENPILSPDDESIDDFDTAVTKLGQAIAAHSHQIQVLDADLDAAQAELMDLTVGTRPDG